MWKEDKIIKLVDPTVYDPWFQIEMMRYINVGLLCVQEFANDRPIVSTVLLMLSSELAELPVPKQPAFTERHTDQEIHSVNNMTVTLVDAR